MALAGTTSNFIAGATFTNTAFNCTTSQLLALDGFNDNITTPIPYTNTTFANWTYECWVNSPSSPVASGPFTGPMYGANMGIIWDHSSGYVGSAHVRSLSGSFYGASYGVLTANTWYHLAATYDGTILSAYKNGVLTASVSTSGGLATAIGSLVIGKHATVANYFNGKIDEVRVWTVARSCTEINSNMNAGLVGNEVGLYAYYNFNQSSTTILTDQSLNGKNGTFNNFSFTGSGSNYLQELMPIITINPTCSVVAIGINNLTTSNNAMILFPNPSFSNVTIQTHEDIKEVFIYNILGDLVRTEKTNTFSIEKLSSGIYMIYVKTEKGMSALRFIKE